MSVSVDPHQADQIDPLNDPAVFARPVARDQADEPCIERVQCGVIDPQDAPGQTNARAHCFPQGIPVGLGPIQQTRVGIIR